MLTNSYSIVLIRSNFQYLNYLTPIYILLAFYWFLKANLFFLDIFYLLSIICLHPLRKIFVSFCLSCKDTPFKLRHIIPENKLFIDLFYCFKISFFQLLEFLSGTQGKSTKIFINLECIHFSKIFHPILLKIIISSVRYAILWIWKDFIWLLLVFLNRENINFYKIWKF